MSNNKLHAIGIMSGTSLDGIDVSYVSSDGKSIFTHNCSSLFKFRESTRKSLHTLVNNFTKNKLNNLQKRSVTIKIIEIVIKSEIA